MKRSRLIALLVLLFTAVAGGTLLLRERGRSVAALDGPAAPERATLRDTAATSAGLEELSREESAPLPAEDADVTPIRGEERVSITETRTQNGRDLVARVVDGRGAPVEDLTLTIQFSTTEKPKVRVMDPNFGVEEAGAEASPPEVWSQTSDAKGLVVFEAMREPVEGLMAKGEVYLEHQVVFLEKPRHTLTPSDLALEEILLVQPDYGTIRGVVHGVDGQAGAPASEVRLEAFDPTREVEPTTDLSPVSFSSEYTRGVAEFAFVELNREWILHAVRDHGFAERTESPGPKRHLDEVEIAVQYGATQPILKLRLLDEHGALLANRPLQATVNNPIQPLEIPYFTTDDRGESLLHVSLAGAFALGATISVLHEDDAGRTTAVESASFEDLQPGIHDLGTLQLLPLPLLAQGIVVDSGNRPVAGATVRLGEQTAYAGESWWGEQALEMETDDSGQFEFRGLLDESPQFVWAFRGEERAKQKALRPGGGEHVLELRSLPTVTVDVLVDPGVPFHHVQVSLVREADGETEPPGNLLAPESESQFSTVFTHVEPGTYGVRVLLPHSETVLDEVAGIPISQTATIATFDLRGRISQHRLLFAAPDGRTLKPNEPQGKFALRPSQTKLQEKREPKDSGAWSEWMHFEGPVLEITTAESAIDVRLMPTEFHAEEAFDVQGERTVLLRERWQDSGG
ncbi:MAG: hypothetical protein AAF368_03745 [Planctomycetota bacterium]